MKCDAHPPEEVLHAATQLLLYECSNRNECFENGTHIFQITGPIKVSEKDCFSPSERTIFTTA